MKDHEGMKWKMGMDRTMSSTMAMAVAKHLTMLSAYFMVAATSRPPAPISSTTSHTTTLSTAAR